MKFSSLVLSLAISSSAAFAPVASRARTSSIFSTPNVEETAATTAAVNGSAAAEEAKPEVVMTSPVEVKPVPDLPVPAQEEKVEIAPVVAAVEESNVDRIIPGRYDADGMSLALPWLKRPNKLDGSHAGDFGFDPLGLSESYDLYTMQEAEIRHARLAMLAVVGWPMAELLGPNWLLQDGGRVPSVLNGFNPITFIATAAIFAGIGFLEYKTSLRNTSYTPSGKKHREDMAEIWDLGVAGDYGFDPAGLYSSIGDSSIARKGLREVEISHGRSAMLGITGFAAWEALTGHAIVENSMFFHPNLLLPALVAGYTAFNAIYEVESNDRYLFQISMTSEGEAKLENLKMAMPSLPAGDADGPGALEKVGEFGEKAKKFFEDIQDGYEKMNDSYLDYSTSNINKKE